jgi:AraC-like DNA-binding protein
VGKYLVDLRLGVARDPNTMAGGFTTLLNHPLTDVRPRGTALAQSRQHVGRSERRCRTAQFPKYGRGGLSVLMHGDGATKLPRTTDTTVDRIAVAIGCRSEAAFRRAFTTEIGCPPTQYRNRTRT